MQIYKGNQYILLFFIYGLTFYSMGIAALLQNTKGESDFRMLKSIKYLGYFGIIHGITEWVLMIMIAQIYPQYDVILIRLSILLNAISFTFLCVFGIKLLEHNKRNRNIFKLLPWVVFGLWLILYSAAPLFYDGDLWTRRWFQSLTSRYFIGLPAGMITAIALHRNAKLMRDIGLTNIAFKINGLSVLFAAYSILAGFIVKKVSFFPANIINKEAFQQLFGFPVELARTIVAIAITILFIGIIHVFKWETNNKIAILTQQQAASRERRRLGMELHDVILQDLFAAGLQLENMLEDEKCSEYHEGLMTIKNYLNCTINKIRNFIGKVASRKMEIEDLRFKVTELIHNFEKFCNIPIEFHCNTTNIPFGQLSSEKLTQIYFIIQEAINNAIKHSKTKKINVTLNATLKSVIATVSDEGKGFDINKIDSFDGYGLFSIRERAKSVNGALEIKSCVKGTIISLSIPWEEYVYEDKKY